MNEVVETLFLLSTGTLGGSNELVSDRNNWYKSVSTLAGADSLCEHPASSDEAIERIVKRSRLDDLFSETVWEDEFDDSTEKENDIEIRPRLWVSNIAGSSVWRKDFRSRARRIFPEAEFGPLKLASFEDHDLSVLDSAINILETEFTEIWDCCKNTIHLIVLHDSQVVSMQNSYTPETIYLGTAILQKPAWVIADAILHESLHERTLLHRQLWRLLAHEYDEDQAPSVHLPWSGGSVPDRFFTPWRLISAAHVYTHLSIFRNTLGLQEEMKIPVERGMFMLEALNGEEFDRCLGIEGRELRDLLLLVLREVANAN